MSYANFGSEVDEAAKEYEQRAARARDVIAEEVTFRHASAGENALQIIQAIRHAAEALSMRTDSWFWRHYSHWLQNLENKETSLSPELRIKLIALAEALESELMKFTR